MKETIRTFIAVKIQVGKKLTEIIHRFRKSLWDENIRWVDTGNLHITLRFLGETNKQQAVEIIDILEKLAGQTPVFQFSLKGMDFFKNRKQPRVLFISTANDTHLHFLSEEIENQIVPLGFKKSETGFAPHLTIGRFKYIIEKDSFFALVNKYSDADIQQVEVSEIIFYQSILGSGGPTYIPIKTVKLTETK
jgi:2'-5' RNA ligase